jgi:hypothetical protein
MKKPHRRTWWPIGHAGAMLAGILVMLVVAAVRGAR